MALGHPLEEPLKIYPVIGARRGRHEVGMTV
jgi:hypothetical protein